MKVLIALIAALIIGAAIAVSGNPTLVGFADALVPIGTLWINAIRMTVIPLVIALLITGVASTSDVKAIGRIGSRTLVVFLSLLVGVAIVSGIVGPLVFKLLPPNLGSHPSLPPGAAEAAEQLGAAGATPTFGA